MPNARDVPNRDLLDELALAFGDDPEVSIGTMFRSPGLRVGGKIFAFLGTDGELIIKLPRERAVELVEEGTAVHVVMGERTMREWIELPARVASGSALSLWTALAQEAHQYVSSLRASK